MIIDIHTHCFPDELAPKAIPKLEERGGIQAMTDGTIKDLKRSMKKAGIDKCVVQHVATKPEQTKRINRWAAEVENGIIYSFGSIHPKYPNWQEEINFLIETGIKGIKFHPYHQNFSVDDQQIYPLYEKIFSADLFILFHMGADLCNLPYNPCSPRHLKSLIRTFPGAPVIAAHMGGYRNWSDVEEYLLGENIYLDTSFSFQELGKERMQQMIDSHGANRILFGSDSPWGNQKEEVRNIQSLALSNENLEMIFWKNTSKILNISAKKNSC